MVDVKQIIIKPIASNIANEFVKKHHYSGKIVNNSKLHLGAFYNNVLHGVMSFGCSLDKRKMLGLVNGTLWNEFLELNRMAFDDFLPKNSESRSLAIAFRIIKKQYPHIKWIVSFADGTQCGDGTIYRASGFLLTQINSKSEMLRMPSGEVRHRIAMHTDEKVVFAMGGKMASVKQMAEKYNAEILSGNQLRYIYFLHSNEKQNLTVPILPFSKIDEMGAGMYKGQKRITCGTGVIGNTSDVQSEDNVRVDCTAQKVAV